jgi:hypothetical protein
MDRDLAARPDRLTPDFSARKARAGAGVERRAIDTGARARRPREERRNRLAVQLTIVAAIWSLGLLVAAVALPVYETTSESADGTTFIATTLVAGQGAWVLIPVLVPLMITGVVALALRSRRAGAGARHSQIAWAAIGLLVAFAAFSILSIGGFAIPVALLLGRATMLTTPRKAPPPETVPRETAPPEPPPARKSLWAS